MTRRRWIADEVSGNRAALTGSHAAHLARVLRARIGQEFDIATGSNIRRGRITSIDNDRVEFELGEHIPAVAVPKDRKSTRLNSSHPSISYAVFCLKKKKQPCHHLQRQRPTSP